MIRRFCFFICVILPFSIELYSQWNWQNPLPQGNTIFDMEFINTEVGWGVGDAGAFIMTADGGTTWKFVDIGTRNGFVSLSFTDENNGWIVGGRGIIMRTYNGGLTWHQQDCPTNNHLGSVFFLDQNHGWICGALGDIMYTNNQGDDWTLTSSGTSNNLQSIIFVDSLYGWCAGNYNTILHSTDGGLTWSPQQNTTPEFFLNIQFLDRNNGWAHGLFRIFKTIDGGENWTIKVNLGGYLTFYDMHFISKDIGWLTGYDFYQTYDGGNEWYINSTYPPGPSYAVYFADSINGWSATGSQIYTSQDYGFNWTKQTEGCQSDLYDIFFVNESTGFAVGESGTIMKTVNSGINWEYITEVIASDLVSICFINEQTGWIVGTDGHILKSDDGGSSWNSQVSPTSSILNDVCFVNNLQGWIATRTGSVLVTVDGENWIQSTVNSSENIVDVEYLNVSEIWACGVQNDISRFYKSVDGGLSWNRVGDSLQTSVTSFKINENHEIWASGNINVYNGIIFYSGDEGNIWTSWSWDNLHLTSISVIGSQIWCTGYDGILITSADFGNKWKVDTCMTYNDLYSNFFINDSTGWICGQKGTILSNTIGSYVTISEKKSPDKNLIKVYPNPFLSDISIERIEAFENYSIEIFDINGNSVYQNNNHNNNSRFTINLKHLERGIYFLNFRNGINALTKKIVKL
jgi:photosystem II stability/assembly factor-like uncharacterized protein